LSRAGHISLFFIVSAVLLVWPGWAASDTTDGPTSSISRNLTDQPVDQAISVNLSSGKPLLLHITNIENPLCRECETALRGQIRELERLRSLDPDLPVLTINIRKNPYSETGRYMVETWWDYNITWEWLEEFEPFPLADRFKRYWTTEGGFSNPTLILLNGAGDVASVHNVYRIGAGMIDGVQSAESLQEEMSLADQGLLRIAEDEKAGQETSGVGMFLLGILTSFAPCSIALMIAVFSYILNSRKGGSRRGISSTREGFMIGVAFTLGMAAVFFVIGLFISQLGIFLRGSRFFDLAAGLIMILLGISNIRPLEGGLEPIMGRIRTLITGKSRLVDRQPRKSFLERVIGLSLRIFEHSALVGAFVLGVFFALGWAPCAVSLVFPVIIWLMAQDVSPLTGGLMLFIFGLGHGVPIIPIATFSRAVGARIGDGYIAAGQYTTKIFGLVVIAVGLVYAARYFGLLLW